MAATVGWPREQWGFNPGAFSELRPGCFDVHERVRDMNANGVLASMNFPTMAGFNARTFTESGDKEIALVMLRAYNDWAIDEWCAAYPGRFIPLAIVPMWDVDLAVEEVHRVAAKGCRSISFLETPHVQGFPSFLSGYWDPMMKALCDTNMVLSLHIGAGFDVIRQPDEAPVDHLMVLACQISAITAQDLLFGPTLRRFPDLKVALSEGGIGWIPFYFDRIDRHFTNQAWLHDGGDFGGKLPVRGLPRAHPGLLHHRPFGPAAARADRASTSSPGSATTRTPTRRGRSRPSSPGRSSRRRVAPRARSTRSPGRTPAGSSTGTPSSTRPRSRRPSERCAASRRVDTTRMPREEWRKRNEAAGIGVF